MKRVLIISLVSLFVLSLLCIGVSAESVVRDDPPVRISPFDDYPYTFTFTSTYPSVTSDVGTLVAQGNFTFNASTYIRLTIYYDSNRVVTRVVLYDGNNDYVVFNPGRLGNTIIINSLTSSDLNTVVSLLSTVEGDYSPYSQGVNYSIGFAGEVLDFILSSQGILALLGLSIALCLIVPFSIRKIKDFVKGY